MEVGGRAAADPRSLVGNIAIGRNSMVKSGIRTPIEKYSIRYTVVFQIGYPEPLFDHRREPSKNS